MRYSLQFLKKILRWIFSIKILEVAQINFLKHLDPKILARSVDESLLSPYGTFIRQGSNEGLLNRLNLTENHVAIVFGAYLGDSIARYRKKFDCVVIGYEPVIEFYTKLLDRFKTDPKVILYQQGVAHKKGTQNIYLNVDETSILRSDFSKSEIIEMQSLEEILTKVQKEFNDADIFIEMNIEGAEFDILEKMNMTSINLKNVKSMLIQFHPFVEDFQNRLELIHTKLTRNFYLGVNYPWVWEFWLKK